MSALRRLRVDKGLSPKELAERSNVSEDQIRNIEQGTSRNPRVATLTKLAKALGVDASAIDPVLNPDERAAA